MARQQGYTLGTDISCHPLECNKGDSLGLLLFVLDSLIRHIEDTCELLLHAWYLDDATIVGGFKGSGQSV
jgi:hypothetical protein